MLGQQIRAWEVLDARVLSVLERTPREQFMPPEYRDLAFADTEIPIGHGQYTMAPKLEGRLLQALRIEPIDRVLEIGMRQRLSDGLFGAARTASAQHRRFS